MTKYQSVKILFDLDDEYQAKLYNHLKNRTNGSSYVRTLLHLDMVKDGQENTSISNNTNAQQSNNPVVKEQNINNEIPINNSRVDIKSTEFQSASQPIIKVHQKILPKEDLDDVYFNDLI